MAGFHLGAGAGTIGRHAIKLGGWPKWDGSI